MLWNALMQQRDILPFSDMKLVIRQTLLFHRPSGLRSEATRSLSRWDPHSERSLA
jgi:hypothetical protein